MSSSFPESNTFQVSKTPKTHHHIVIAKRETVYHNLHLFTETLFSRQSKLLIPSIIYAVYGTELFSIKIQ